MINKPERAREPFIINKGDYEVNFRLPNSGDLLDLPRNSDESLARRQVLKKCLKQARRDGKDVCYDELPEEILSAIVQSMTEMDPQADFRLGLQCRQCGYQWSETFDILSFLWSEIHTYALRLLREVHVLASAYGWSEAEILTLGSIRRQAYLELIRNE